MAGRAQSRRHAAASLAWLMLACAGPADAEFLYRCSNGDSPVRWQAHPCEPGEQQRSLEYEPEPLRAAAARPPAPVKPAPRPRAAAPSSQSRARRDPARERAAEACRKATVLARERNDDQGRRLPLKLIRERERQARRACAY